MNLTVWNVNLQRCDVSSYTFMHSNDDNNNYDDDDDYYYYFILILHRLFCNSNSNSNSKNTNNLIYDLLLSSMNPYHHLNLPSS